MTEAEAREIARNVVKLQLCHSDLDEAEQDILQAMIHSEVDKAHTAGAISMRDECVRVANDMGRKVITMEASPCTVATTLGKIDPEKVGR